MSELDRTDRRILNILKEDGRISYRKLARKIRVAESTARKRVVRLKENGVIKRITIELNPTKLGKTVTAFITVYPIPTRSVEIIKEVTNLDEVSESFYLSGRCGMLLKVFFSDIPTLNEFVAKIRSIPGIMGINTCIVLETINKSYEQKAQET